MEENNMLNIKITPQRDALLRILIMNHDYQVKADENIAENKENTLNLAIAIDCLVHAGVLQEAKRSAMMMVDLMQSTDRVAIIAYDSSASLIVPSTL